MHKTGVTEGVPNTKAKELEMTKQKTDRRLKFIPHDFC